MSSRDKRPEEDVQDAIDRAVRDWAADVPSERVQYYGVATRILSVARLVERSFEKESRKVGLNIGEMLVLDALRRQGPPYETTAARLKDLFFISFAGIGKRVARLEEAGYIERNVDPRDRRGQIIRLTKAGPDLIHESQNAGQSEHIAALADMEPADLEKLGELLRELQHRIEGHFDAGCKADD